MRNSALLEKDMWNLEIPIKLWGREWKGRKKKDIQIEYQNFRFRLMSSLSTICVFIWNAGMYSKIHCFIISVVFYEWFNRTEEFNAEGEKMAQLPLCPASDYHDMKTWRAVEIQIQAFLTLVWRGWVVWFRPRPFSPRRKFWLYQWIRSLVNSSAAEKKNFVSAQIESPPSGCILFAVFSEIYSCFWRRNIPTLRIELQLQKQNSVVDEGRQSSRT
jgi:hypothetical protein